MKDDNSTHEDALIKKMFAQYTIEEPAQDFTSRVLDKVKEAQRQQTVYKPLISKNTWVFMGVCFAAVLVVGLFTVSPKATQFLNFSVLHSLSEMSLSNTFSNLKLSSVLVYAVCFLSIMICVQIPLLKSMFNKRYTY